MDRSIGTIMRVMAYDGCGGGRKRMTMSGNEEPMSNGATSNAAGAGGSGGGVAGSGTGRFDEFRANNYDDALAYITKQVDEAKKQDEEDDEKKAEREKREKRLMTMGRIADIMGNMHKSFSYGMGVQPMHIDSVSDKVQARIDKAKAEREKRKDKILNYLIMSGELKDKMRESGFRVAQAEQAQSNWQSQFDAARQDRADDVKFRKDSFDENQRQFDVTSKEHERHNRASEGLQAAGIAETRRHNKASEGLERQRFAASQDGKYTEFYSGNGMVRIPNTRLNQHNLAFVYSKILIDAEDKEGNPTKVALPTSTTDSNGKVIPVSAEQMMQAIGAHIDDPNVQSALRAIGGVTTSEDNTPPSRRNNNQNTPPSRR